ncbi:MAG: sulfite exporter TauE/SafE family protein [Xanthomonadales bacterium]|nr:sulfite exporter TauE/SafE family protein [Xanthomonadales bacterium]
MQIDVPWLEFILIGAAAGYLAGFLGIGGGLVTVPALTWLFLLRPETADRAIHFAVATSLATMLVTSLSSIIAHHRRDAVIWKEVWRLVPGLLAGAAAGAVLADALAPLKLTLVFAAFACLAGLQLLLSPAIHGEKPLPGNGATTGVGLVIGAISSMVGIGGGSMTGPWLLWHGIRAQKAVATAAACGYPIALAGTLAFVVLGESRDLGGPALGYVYGPAWVAIALTGALFAPLGAATVHRLSPVLVKRIFGAVLILIALRLGLSAGGFLQVAG